MKKYSMGTSKWKSKRDIYIDVCISKEIAFIKGNTYNMSLVKPHIMITDSEYMHDHKIDIPYLLENFEEVK